MPRDSQVGLDAIIKNIQAEKGDHVELLKQALIASFGEVEKFQRWIAAQMKEAELDIEEFTVDLDKLAQQPAMQKSLQNRPTKVVKGPNLLGTIRGVSEKKVQEPGQRGLTVFAHADKPAETYEWGKDFRETSFQNGKRLTGPGIGDDVAGIAAALSAVKVLRNLKWSPRSEFRLASVLGKQLGVFGTYGLVTKYKPSGAAIYVHPPASGGGLRDLIIGALGMVEFAVNVKGKPPETTEPWKPIFEKTAVNPIYKGLHLVSKLRNWADEIEENQVYRHEGVEEVAGRSFVVSIGRFLAGVDGAAYQFPSQCEIGGVIHFSPRANAKDIQSELMRVVESIKNEDPWLSAGQLQFEWGDVIAEPFEVDPRNPFVQTVKQTIEEASGVSPRFYFGHSVSDIRYPVIWWGVPAVGLGPKVGNLGKPDEYIDADEYLQTIAILASLIANFA